MQTFRSFIHEGKYPVWVRTVVAGLVVKVTKLDQVIAATDDPVKQNVLMSHQNKLLSYMNGLGIGVGSTDHMLLKKMKGIGRRS
jgi:hypothetical protein